MNDDRLNVGVGDIRKIKMSPEEKRSALEHVLSTSAYPLFKRARKKRPVYHGLISGLIAVKGWVKKAEIFLKTGLKLKEKKLKH